MRKTYLILWTVAAACGAVWGQSDTPLCTLVVSSNVENATVALDGEPLPTWIIKEKNRNSMFTLSCSYLKVSQTKVSLVKKGYALDKDAQTYRGSRHSMFLPMSPHENRVAPKNSSPPPAAHGKTAALPNTDTTSASKQKHQIVLRDVPIGATVFLDDGDVNDVYIGKTKSKSHIIKLNNGKARYLKIKLVLKDVSKTLALQYSGGSETVSWPYSFENKTASVAAETLVPSQILEDTVSVMKGGAGETTGNKVKSSDGYRVIKISLSAAIGIVLIIFVCTLIIIFMRKRRKAEGGGSKNVRPEVQKINDGKSAKEANDKTKDLIEGYFKTVNDNMYRPQSPSISRKRAPRDDGAENNLRDEKKKLADVLHISSQVSGKQAEDVKSDQSEPVPAPDYADADDIGEDEEWDDTPVPKPVTAPISAYLYLSNFRGTCFTKALKTPAGAFYRMWFDDGASAGLFEFFDTGNNDSSKQILSAAGAHLYPVCKVSGKVNGAKKVITEVPGRVKISATGEWELVEKAKVKVE
jgi:hypothetical protein